MVPYADAFYQTLAVGGDLGVQIMRYLTSIDGIDKENSNGWLPFHILHHDCSLALATKFQITLMTSPR